MTEVRRAYNVSGATRLMHRLGFSPPIPGRRVAEHDEQAVTVWKEVTRDEVKKPRRAAGDASASRTRQASPADRPNVAPGAGADTRSCSQRPALRTTVGGRADRDAAQLPHRVVPPPVHPPCQQRTLTSP
ncbi:winged helix-turn-helix domain-containing protein [Actinacidiphila glaucinigra]|uniref:helix-turn-helix domain-containing protein n=1 Tax=Actinacidiphila glaucinigra TaxID=235986 RepID=UPI003244ABCE